MKKIVLLAISLIMVTTCFAAIRFGKNKVQKQAIDWAKMETTHFDVYYRADAVEFGQIAALMAEEAYYYLKEDFDKPIRYRIPIIFYETHSDFETTNIIYPLLSEGVGGFTEHMKNRVVVPFDGSYTKLEEVLIHELTHSYQKAIASFKAEQSWNITTYSLPFWFSEGQPEFMAVGGRDNYNNMFIVDMLMNDYMPWLENAGGYHAYRVGESFLTWVAEKYGRDKIQELMFALRSARDPNSATEKVFGKKFVELQILWRADLKRKYYPLLDTFDVPFNKYRQRTRHHDDNSYFNDAPRFSPDGLKYLYFSNANGRMGIWKGTSLGIAENELVLQGEDTGRFEEFHYQRVNLAWMPDGIRVAFVAKTTTGDRIYILNAEDERIERVYQMSEMENIYEIDIASDGRRMVFSGQKDMAVDLYVMDMETEAITQITHDRYNDSNPRWSPDGARVAFTSERPTAEDLHKRHIFQGLRDNVYYHDFRDNLVYAVTGDTINNRRPLWSKDGNAIIFLSDKDYISNYEIVSLTTGQRARITNALCGIISGDIDPENDALVFSCYYDNGFNLFMMDKPLENLTWRDYRMPQTAILTDDFATRFNIDDYRYFGKRDLKYKKEFDRHSDGNFNTIDFDNIAQRDSLAREYNQRLDLKPTNKENPPIPQDYSPEFNIDRFWGGMAYSTGYGFIGQVQLSMSDIMGDHGIGVLLGMAGKIEDSSILLNYLYLADRVDYGFGIYYLNDEVIYDNRYYKPNTGRWHDGRELDRRYGVYSLVSYPFNRFWRLELENSLYQRELREDVWASKSDSADYEWINIDKWDAFVYCPQINMVYDNALNGNTGPVSGWRCVYLISKSFSDEFDYFTNYTDVRRYFLFNKRYSVALRALGGISVGDQPQQFEINGINGVRGFDKTLRGDRKFLFSAELRYPFLDYLQIGFPLPIGLSNIRGSAFVDAGAVWFEEDGFVGYEDERLNDLKFGFGLGPRINLGYFVLKVDVAWESDFHGTSEPRYYFWLSPDF